jgi:CBS domain-containing protein
MSSQVFEFLSEIEPFSDLPENELQKLAEKITVENKNKGAKIYMQGKSKVENLMIIKTGTLEVYNEIGDKKNYAEFLQRGNIVGSISILMNGGTSIRTVEVDKDVSLYCLPREAFLETCNRFKSFYEYFVEIYSKRMLDESYASIMATGQAVQFLSTVVPFTFLPEEELEKVAAKLSIVHYPKGAIPCIQGHTRLEYLYIIQKGAGERYIEENDQKRLRGLLGEGDIYGGISLLLNNSIAVRTLKCTEDTYFYILSSHDFLDLCSRYDAFSEYFTDTFGKRMLDRSYASIITKTLRPKEEEQQFFNQPVENIYNQDLVYCSADETIQKAAQVMNRHRCSSVFVKDRSSGKFVGLVTDSDLRRKVIARGYDMQKPIADIMNSPIYTIPSKALIFEAMMLMTQKGIKHLGVLGNDEDVIGVVTNKDFLNAQGKSPFFLVREIAEVTRLEDVFNKHAQLPPIIKRLINSGAKAKNVTRLITAVSDAILEKLVGFALEEMGPPPSDFVFMIMGSEGRKEQTLKTDQDNAIVFRDVSPDQEEAVRAYFLEFGEKVCTWLDKAGYEFCKGNVMAKNPKWCQPLSKWKYYFSSWIYSGGPEELLQASIFFDFRGGYGDMSIIDELHEFLFDSLGGWIGFFRNLTINALHFKPPLGFFRNFVVESKGEHQNAFDIKAAMQPIVDFARIYALKNKISETNTQDRLHELYLKKYLLWDDYNEIDQAYSFLMQTRFVRQITAIMDENTSPNNYINPKKLSRIEQTMLKEIFKRVEKLQAGLGFEFTGIG